jgi:uncharacterized protein
MLDRQHFIDFDEIDKHGPQTISGTYEFTPQELDRAVELAALGPVSIEATAGKSELPGEYLIDGASRFTADFTCARCLEPYPFANSASFHLRFRPRLEVSQENEEVEIVSDDLDVEFYTGRSLSLRDLAAEQVQLAIPMKPLCEEGCLGLCPTCGANRNREQCACEATAGDERWGALQEFREQLAKKKNL